MGIASTPAGPSEAEVAEFVRLYSEDVPRDWTVEIEKWDGKRTHLVYQETLRGVTITEARSELADRLMMADLDLPAKTATEMAQQTRNTWVDSRQGPGRVSGRIYRAA